MVRKMHKGTLFQGLTIALQSTPGNSRWTEREQRQMRNVGGRGVEYSVQHPVPADAFVSQFSTRTCALWLQNYGVFIPSPLKQ